MTDLNTLLLDAIDDDETNPLSAEAVDFALTCCGLDDVLHGDDDEDSDICSSDIRGNVIASIAA